MPSTPTQNTSLAPRKLRLIAVALTAASLWLLYLGAFRPPGVEAPSAIMYVLAVLLVLTAIRVLELSSGKAGNGNWYGMLAFTAFAIVGWWIALKGDPAKCSIGFLFFVIPHGGAICRGAFMIGAALCSLVPLVWVWRLVSQRLGD